MSSPPRPPLKRTRTMSKDGEGAEGEERQDGGVQALTSTQLDRFSRQNAALGAETTARLIKMKVAIVGCRGTGIETAKNLALQGAGGITLVDSEPTQMKDLGCNFFLFAEDAQKGISRAVACAPRLQELNPICEINVAETLTDEVITAHSAVVITQFRTIAELTRINELCRAKNVSFFYAFNGGVSSTIFVDHGPNHTVHDPDGERPLQKLIVGVTPLEDECLIRYETPEGQVPVGIDSGTYEVTEVEGVDGINDQLYPVTHSWKDPVKTIRIPKNINALPKYITGGLLTQKKMPKKVPMTSFAEKVKSPGFPGDGLVMTDLLGFTELQQHVAFVAVHQFAGANDRMPGLYNEADAASVVSLAKDFVSEVDIELDLDESLLNRTSALCSVELQPLGAFIGGVLAQEVVKCTGKFTPIPGFMHFSCPDALPDELPGAGEASSPRGSRNDEVAAVYGWPFVEKIGDLNYFMVGCGALGCEFMKNFALNGIFCGPKGKLTVTDADRIELSNLSRQFLFREHNVGQPKSKAAGAMATVMNENFKVESMEHFVGPKSEDIFNDSFWLRLDGVCNALDNMEARLYVDSACVKYEKSLLESGTMGTSGNVDTIAPFKTRTYAEGGAAAEGGGVPMCTLRNFPHLTDHCIEWARDQFELLFVKLGKSAQNYLENPSVFEEKVRDMSKSEPGVAFFDCRCLTSLLRAAKNPTIGAAAQLAFDLFHYLFRDRILDLQAAFPRDARMTDENKNDIGPFWSEKKRYPSVVAFNAEDDSHVDYMISCTCLFAAMLGLVSPKEEGDNEWCAEFRSRDWLVGVVSSLSPPEYIQAPVSGAGLEGPDNSEAQMDAIIDRLFNDLRGEATGLHLPSLEPADFEKDDDYNFHISFITSACNLRCDNYTIKRTDFQACKVIAGKIIAAIATTTAAVCGLVILELFKLVLDLPTDKLMNRQIGLATNAFTSFTQEPPKKFTTVVEKIVPAPSDVPEDAFDQHGKIKDEYITEETRMAYPENHTVWDKMEVSGDQTLAGFSKWLETEHGLKLQSWNFIYGRKNVEVEGKKTESPVTAPVFPPKPVLDYSLIPALDLSKAQATQTLMRNPKAKPLQQYIALWDQCKKDGMIPEGPADNGDAITGETTLRQILSKMSVLAESAKQSRSIDTAAISALEGRRFWMIPSSETPVCVHAESFDEVTTMVALKITL